MTTIVSSPAVDGSGRKLRSEAEWRALMADFKRWDGTRSSFCKAPGGVAEVVPELAPQARPHRRIGRGTPGGFVEVENDIRSHVTRRKIPFGTRSEAGRTARDACLGALKTCNRLGVSFGSYPHKRLGVAGAPDVPGLADLIRQRATAWRRGPRPAVPSHPRIRRPATGRSHGHN